MNCPLHNAQFNVEALADTTGDIVERYTFTPYGQRFVLNANWTADGDGLSDVGLNIGHQGLYHDAETGSGGGLIYNRARMLHPVIGRFMQRDPYTKNVYGNPSAGDGYQDGMLLYQILRSKPLDNLDPTGQVLAGCAPTPRIPRNAGECCAAAKNKEGIHQGDGGGVICCDGQMIACNWTWFEDGDPLRDEVEAIVEKCKTAHEQNHFGVQEPCRNKIPSLYRAISTIYADDAEAIAADECPSYKIEIDCFTSSLETATTEAVKQAIRNAIRKLTTYANKEYGCGFK